jgi:hypothetical protein
MITTRVPRSGAVETRAPDEVGSPTRKNRWAFAVPMTGVRYYRFLPDVPDPEEPVEPDRSTAAPKDSGTEHEASVRGGS